MRPLEVLEFYSKCKAPTKEEKEMKALRMSEKEYKAFQDFRQGKSSDLWFLISNKNYAIG